MTVTTPPKDEFIQRSRSTATADSGNNLLDGHRRSRCTSR